MRMRIIALVLANALASASGCARPDWIQQTLVTVDVTGVWSGEVLSRSTGGGTAQSSSVSFTLDQKGSRVTGSFQVSTSGAAIFQYLGAKRSGPIEGTVAGDVFSFTQMEGGVNGELTVSGDEMAGRGRWSTQLVSFYLRRADVPPRPSSPRP